MAEGILGIRQLSPLYELEACVCIGFARSDINYFLGWIYCWSQGAEKKVLGWTFALLGCLPLLNEINEYIRNN